MSEIKLGRYRHFKGNEYLAIYTAKHSETLEEMVVYRALYGEGGVWVRPASMWNELVEVNGEMVPRFTYLEEEGDFAAGERVRLKNGQEAEVVDVIGTLYIVNVFMENDVMMQTVDRRDIAGRV